MAALWSGCWRLASIAASSLRFAAHVVLVAVTASAGRADDGETIVFRKPLDDGREVVVVRGPDVPREELAGLITRIEGAPVMKGAEGIKLVYFPVRIELHADGKTPIVWSARLGVESRWPEGESRGFERSGFERSGFEVFDVLMPPPKIDYGAYHGILGNKVLGNRGIVVAKDALVVATGEDYCIHIWRVDYRSARDRVLPDGGWSPYAFSHPPSKSFVRVKLSRRADYLVEVEVFDLRTGLQSHFVQVEGKDWEFTSVEKRSALERLDGIKLERLDGIKRDRRG